MMNDPKIPPTPTILITSHYKYSILRRVVAKARPLLIVIDDLVKDTNKQVSKSSFLAEKGGHYGSKKFKKK